MTSLAAVVVTTARHTTTTLREFTTTSSVLWSDLQCHDAGCGETTNYIIPLKPQFVSTSYETVSMPYTRLHKSLCYLSNRIPLTESLHSTKEFWVYSLFYKIILQNFKVQENKKSNFIIYNIYITFNLSILVAESKLRLIQHIVFFLRIL